MKLKNWSSNTVQVNVGFLSSCHLPVEIPSSCHLPVGHPFSCHLPVGLSISIIYLFTRLLSVNAHKRSIKAKLYCSKEIRLKKFVRFCFLEFSLVMFSFFLEINLGSNSWTP